MKHYRRQDISFRFMILNFQVLFGLLARSGIFDRADIIIFFQVNVVILSDHGMTYGSEPIGGMPRNSMMMHGAPKGLKKAHLSRALRGLHRSISMVVGSGAYSMIYLKDERYRIKQ